mgnify:CR=1 FL=1
MLNRESFKMFNEISASKELKNKIIKQTIKKDEEKFVLKKEIPRYAFILIIVFSIALIGCGGVLASDLIQKYILKTNTEDNYIINQYLEITKPVDIKNYTDDPCENARNLRELEKKLGIKFVFETDKYNTDIGKCEVKYNSAGKIESIDITVRGFFDFADYNSQIDANFKENITSEKYWERNNDLKILDLYITFMTKEASEETKNKYANFEVENRRIDTEITEFYLSNINTYGFFLPSPNKRLDFSRSIYFVYDNILYVFFTNKPLQAEEVVELLKTF